MRRFLVTVGLLAVAAATSLTVASMASQAGQNAASSRVGLPKAGPAPKMPWGDPDLQGTWFVMEAVPLERSNANAGKEFLTDEEVAEADKAKGVAPGRNSRSANAVADVEGAYNAVFNSVLRTSKRTSMIINPKDGRIPVIQGAQRGGRAGGGGGGRGAGGRGGNPNDNPETTAQNPRCLGVQMPFLPLNTLFAQGTVLQIVQGQKSMTIYMEDDHAGGGNRIIHMDGRPRLPANIKKVLGDSRGRWEGSALVVETTNFVQGFRGANPETYKMTERFTRVDSNNLRREITFEDPNTWTQPWTVLIEMGKTDDRRHMIFDSACHEGNYGLTGILAGARRAEQNPPK
jgi:hypothetical protein